MLQSWQHLTFSSFTAQAGAQPVYTSPRPGLRRWVKFSRGLGELLAGRQPGVVNLADEIVPAGDGLANNFGAVMVPDMANITLKDSPEDLRAQLENEAA